MDAFYASVEILDNPALKGAPVIVGGLGARGVVSTASYAARAYGVHSGLPISQAKRLCPNGVYIHPRIARYQELSAKIMEVFHRYTPLVEPLSLDEAFLDVTGSLKLFGEAPKIARRVKDEVLAETKLTVSAGVATQKHIAKIASGYQKPDGLTVVKAGEEKDFLWPLPLSRLWGVGKVTLKTLEGLGLKTIGDLAKVPFKDLANKLGESGRKLWRLANCVDEREVEPEREIKSIGHEETYEVDIDGEDRILTELLSLAVRVAKRMRANEVKGKTLTLKVRDKAFKTITRSRSVSLGLNDHREIYKLARELFPWDKKGPFRLLGLSVSNFQDPNGQESPMEDLFFNQVPKPTVADSRLMDALDKINDRFGDKGLKPASLLDKPGRKS
jgi:DNA polymerase-4